MDLYPEVKGLKIWVKCDWYKSLLKLFFVLKVKNYYDNLNCVQEDGNNTGDDVADIAVGGGEAPACRAEISRYTGR